MSAYSETTTNITDQALLVEALKELGFKPGSYEKPIQLEGYHGDKRKQRAHVVIPRAQVGGASNDIGFFQPEPGKPFQAIISQFDSHRYGKPWLGKLAQSYTVQRSLKVAHEKGYVFQGRSVVQTQQGPKIQLRFSTR